MNKYELKYMYEQEATKVENLIDINGKNAHHLHDKLIARLNDKREEAFKLKTIIKSQQEKNLAEYHFPNEVDN
jgi:hypothetical protein